MPHPPFFPKIQQRTLYVESSMTLSSDSPEHSSVTYLTQSVVCKSGRNASCSAHTHRTCKVPTISSTDPADDPLLKELNAAFSSRVSPKEATELALKK